MPQQIIRVTPKTDAQSIAFDHWEDGSNLLLYGSAKTGKTFIALYLAMTDALETRRKIYIVRSAVPSREIGFLPGTYAEKIAMYELPYRSIINTLTASEYGYQNLKDNDLIEFITTSFLRGQTYDDCIFLIDEFQNFTFSELDTCITRIGKNARLIICGDFRQNDLKGKETSCFNQARAIFTRMCNFGCVQFFPADIVASQLAKEWLLAQESSVDASLHTQTSHFPAFLQGGKAHN